LALRTVRNHDSISALTLSQKSQTTYRQYLQGAADHVDAALRGEGDTRSDSDLESGVSLKAHAHEQLADQNATLDLSQGVADAGARPVAEREEAVLGRGEVGGLAFEALRVKLGGVLPDGGISVS